MFGIMTLVFQVVVWMAILAGWVTMVPIYAFSLNLHPPADGNIVARVGIYYVVFQIIYGTMVSIMWKIRNGEKCSLIQAMLINVALTPVPASLIIILMDRIRTELWFPRGNWMPRRLQTTEA